MRNFQFSIFNFRKEQGFTLVETLVAIAILLVAVTGAYSAAQTGLSGAIYSRDEVTAFYLAQEGVEQIRNMRDENGLSGRAWLANFAGQPGDPCYFGSSCTIDATQNQVLSCGTSACPTLRLDPVNGFYGYNSAWSLTPFTRSIALTQISSDEVQIAVTVTWNKGTSSRTFRIKENIMNWQ